MKIPETPLMAHAKIKAIAESKNMTIHALLKRINMETSRWTVDRWQRNRRTFDVTLFRQIVEESEGVKRVQKTKQVQK